MEKIIVPFSGETGKDAYTVDRLIEEVEIAMRTGGMREEDQTEFILSHPKGSTLDEVKLRVGGQVSQPKDLFSYLGEAFIERSAQRHSCCMPFMHVANLMEKIYENTHMCSFNYSVLHYKSSLT